MMIKREEETIMLVRWFSSYKDLMSSLDLGSISRHSGRRETTPTTCSLAIT